MDITEIGRNHLRDALTGALHHCTVSEWLDEDQNPVEIYWKPLTGNQQKQIESFRTLTEQTAMVVKLRALYPDGRPIFKDTPIETIMADFDYSVIKSIAFLISTDTSHDDEARVEAIEKE